jgi:hypothetical protein
MIRRPIKRDVRDMRPIQEACALIAEIGWDRFRAHAARQFGIPEERLRAIVNEALRKGAERIEKERDA